MEELMRLISNSEEVNNYREQATHKSDLERMDLAKEKTGVILEGVSCLKSCD